MPVSERDPLIGTAKEKPSSNFLGENPIVGEVSGVSYIDPNTVAVGSSDRTTAYAEQTPDYIFESSSNVPTGQVTSKQTIENDLRGPSWTPTVKLPGHESIWNDIESAGSQPRRYLTCHVPSCQQRIDITDRTHEYVIKCPHCGEGSPLQNAPPGKKYVRCSCSCLLVCKTSAQRIRCPRERCQTTINLGSNTTVPTVAQNRMCRVICGHCSTPFLFDVTTNSLVKCPHSYCQKVSSVGATFAKKRAHWYLTLGFGLLLTFAIVLWSTINSTNRVLWFVVYVFLFVPAIINLYRCYYYLQMKISEIDETS